ncbi:MAG: hypothetical protein R2826_11720 [Thermoleophilia bacterium]
MDRRLFLTVSRALDKRQVRICGTRATDELAREWGMDAGFGRGTKGRDVALSS